MPDPTPAPSLVEGAAPSVVEWRPGTRAAAVLNVAGLALAGLGLWLFGTLWAATHVGDGQTVTFQLNGAALLGLVAVVVLTLVLSGVHELLHGLALRTLGHRPRYGATLVGGVMPAFYTTSPGAVMSRAGFTWVALLPGVVLAVLPALWIALGPWGGWLVLPAALLLGGCVGDIALVGRAWRSPRGTRVEDMKDGLRLHLPTP